MSKEYLEALNGLFDLVHCQDSFEKAQRCFDIVEEALDRLEAIDNSNPSEALECLEWLTSSLIGKYNLFYEEVLINEEEYKESIECIKDDYNIIKQALLKEQEKEKEKLLFKNIHNAKVKTPLVSIFEGLSKDERFKFTEHIYYHWEEMKEALEDKNNELEKENARSEEILQKYYQEGITLDSVRALKQERDNYKKVLEIIKEKAVDVYVLFDLGLEEYNKYVLKRYGTYYQLTQEEFNLLKEVLE